MVVISASSALAGIEACVLEDDRHIRLGHTLGVAVAAGLCSQSLGLIIDSPVCVVANLQARKRSRKKIRTSL
jgi:hypothetical protein